LADTFSENHLLLIRGLMERARTHLEAFQLGLAAGESLRAGIEPDLKYLESAMGQHGMSACARFCRTWIEQQCKNPGKAHAGGGA
jgi:hypothetical protein